MGRAFSSASSMVCPVTNCSPIMRMAMSTPLRTNGSPPLATSRPRAADMPASLCVDTSLPVSIRPQAAALTNSEGALPRCSFQFPSRILSRIRASRVAASGIRSSASARHMSATPSWDDNENSCSSPCTRPDRPRPCLRRRSLRVMSSASAWLRSATPSARRAASTRGGTASVSGSRHAAVIARRNKERGGCSVISAKCCNTCGGAAWAAGAEGTVDMRRLPGITQSETTDVHIMVWINKPNFSPYLAIFIDKTSMKEDSSGLDRIDIEILELLQRDGRMPNTRLAEAVSLSPTAVLARVQRLTRERYILGYEARLNPRKLQAGLLVFVQVLLDRSGLNVFDEFKAAV